MELDHVNQLLKPGYMPMETGYYHMPDGKICVAALTRMPGCRSKWVDWWIGTYLKDTQTYKEWEPKSHLFYKWDEKWSPGKYIGASHYGIYLISGKIRKFRLRYEDPAKYFDTSKFQDAGVGTVICGEGFLMDGTPDGRVIHVVRDTEDGCEMRSRFWINNDDEELGMGHMKHCLSEMDHLADNLKMLMKKPSPSSDVIVSCKFCHSNEVVKNGLRKNLQYWLCKNCGRGFANNQALPGMRYSISTLASAVNGYYAGKSLNQIRREIEQKTNILPSSSAVYSWVKRVTQTAIDESIKYRPVVGDIWFVHVCVTRQDSKYYRLVNVIDSDTGFILATRLSDKESNYLEVQSLIIEAKKRAGKIPDKVITSGNKEYAKEIEVSLGISVNRVFSDSDIEKNLPDNYLQSWENFLHSKLKPWKDTAISDSTSVLLNGFAFNYNYLQNHGNIKQPPAEIANIQFPFNNWSEIISAQYLRINGNNSY